MAFNGSGVFLRIHNWVTDKTNLVPVTASRMDAEFDGIATGLSNVITKDGQTAITASIPWNSQNLTGVGALTVTGTTASTDADTGCATFDGGVGINGTVNIGGALVVTGGITTSGKFSATSQPCFSAHKNGTNQTGIANGVFTKATFGTEVFDIGSHYDASTSRWTPPAGIVCMSAASLLLSMAYGNLAVISIYKNGVRFKDGTFTIVDFQANLTADDVTGAALTIIDRTNGTDYYEVFVFCSTSATASIDGTASASYFMGFAL